MGKKHGHLAEGLYDYILALYPKSYIATYGDDMRQLFRDTYREYAADRQQTPVSFWAHIIADALTTCWQEWMRSPGDMTQAYAAAVYWGIRLVLSSLLWVVPFAMFTYLHGRLVLSYCGILLWEFSQPAYSLRATAYIFVANMIVAFVVTVGLWRSLRKRLLQLAVFVTMNGILAGIYGIRMIDLTRPEPLRPSMIALGCFIVFGMALSVWRAGVRSRLIAFYKQRSRLFLVAVPVIATLAGASYMVYANMLFSPYDLNSPDYESVVALSYKSSIVPMMLAAMAIAALWLMVRFTIKPKPKMSWLFALVVVYAALGLAHPFLLRYNDTTLKEQQSRQFIQKDVPESVQLF